ncbi:COP9 signalosome complex subunit 5a [Ectocarpus siliculosus]|uniref:COP9 signalosome complex subunit 5a n=1 Tax=Ectocarpus siliculosus TaxID=2880 RepID=D7G460_ECTSI|nr:COP9 signalosome complex subunit 5a [Ectocarpus siliculosus]|eukprot:CBJ27075.1 COP9 signalosome complex subunit 5a [Ectocarpus siliculosus]
MADTAYGGGAAAAPSVETSAPSKDSRDSLYSFDEAKLELTRKTKPWMQDPKYFKKVKISPSAAMKMLMHANSGVEKGMAAGGKPVEIMGMMLGRPDTETANALIVTDVFPLPVEGAETKVLADDQEVANYMIGLGDLLETTRKERFMGWYHSHPFDVEVHSHCFLSSTDISTQLSWQRAEDPHGNPWLAIVVDPLRSLAKSRPEFGAFRVYPPEFNAPLNETPDGKIVTDDSQRVELWGACWNRYYSMEIEYFMSSLASDVMGILTENFLWMRTLGSTPILESENRERFSERIGNVADKVEHCDVHMNHGAGTSVSGYLVADSAASKPKEESAISKATHGSSELAIEHCQGQMTQITKSIVFGIK